jgi:hypothetical protein
MDENEGTTQETLESLVEIITRKVLDRLSSEGINIAQALKCPHSQNYNCTGDYKCSSSYKCVGSKHGCSGVFDCSNIHKWKANY